MLIDLHTHTFPLSDDSFLKPDELVEQAKAAGLDGVCLTEHDFFWEPANARELARRHSFLVISGVEVNTEDGHMLVFGIDRYVYGMHRMRDLSALVEQAGGAIVAAHPYRRLMPFYPADDELWSLALERALASPAFRHVCALEAINGHGSQHENLFSWQLCARLGLPGVAGSDAHHAREVGTCATRFQHPIAHVGDLVRELKAGRFNAVNLRPKAEPEEADRSS
jgi:predicted metal-dependent phosphoesterase TrpH